MAMRVPATNYEWDRRPAGVTEKEFDSRKDLLEGINGRDRFNANFENTERGQVLAPRGDARGRPMPRDAKFQTADNHDCWGPDQYHVYLEGGMDGPDSVHSYHGAGLPKRADLSYPIGGVDCTDIGTTPSQEGNEGDI